jgi:endo-1,4-beta-xylanase
MKRMHLGRRDFLIGVGTLASTGAIMATPSTQKIQANTKALVDPLNRSFAIKGKEALRVRAAAKGLFYGAFPSVGKPGLDGNSDYRSAFIRECGILTGGVYWQTIQSDVMHYDFSQVDFFAQFARDHQMLFRGHPLVWHKLLPDWLTDKLASPHVTSGELEGILMNHISVVVRRYAGQVHSWDVVNEALNLEDGQAQGLRRSLWFDKLGSRYLDIAFWTARSADPSALLVFNHDLLEHDTPDDDARRWATLDLLSDLKSRDVPVQALGLQSHLAADRPFDFGKLRQFLKDVADLGLKILITELDVKDQSLPANINTRDRMVASIYEDFLATVLDEPAVIGVITWGLSDRHTWLAEITPRQDDLPLRPLPLDEGMKRKLAWNGIAQAFDTCPARTT